MCESAQCRWEWRTFSTNLGDLSDKLSAAAGTPSKQSHEIYLLGNQSVLNLKVRNDALELKRLAEADSNGLQRWCPTGHLRFPEPAQNIYDLLAPFKLELALDNPSTREDFLSRIAHGTELTAFDVQKSRRIFTFHGCIAELTQVSTNGWTGQTFCMESDSRSKLLEALRELNLPPTKNTSWPQHLTMLRESQLAPSPAALSANMEIERKFLVDARQWQPSTPGTTFRQGYLSSTAERVVRVRIAGDKGTLTIKGRSVGISRPEFEYDIPLEDAQRLLDGLCERPLIEKTRYREQIAGKVWEIDVFHGDNEGLVIAEIELHDPAETFEKPRWAGPDVSHDPKYFNNNLIACPFRDWPPEDR